MAKLGLLFAGQGAQYTNMGLDYLLNNKDVIETYQSIFGYNPIDIIKDTTGLINQTEYTQPLVFLVTVLALEAFKKLDVEVAGCAGFSLGEYSALYESGVIDLETSLKLIQARSNFMKLDTQARKGKMAAVIGLNPKEVQAVLNHLDPTKVVIANYNSDIQSVISGDEEIVNLAITALQQAGAKRVIPLAVSGAFHSPLMHNASLSFKTYLDGFELNSPNIDLYLNTTAEKADIHSLKDDMANQIKSSVRFTEIIRNMVRDGYTHLIEIGPGTVLSGLVRKIDDTLKVSHLDSYQDLENLKGWLIENGFTK